MKPAYDWDAALRLALEGRTAAQIGAAIGCKHLSLVCTWAQRRGLVLQKHIPVAQPKLRKSEVTQAILREAFDYCPETGALTHKHDKPSSPCKGRAAGHLDLRKPSYPRWTLRFRGQSWIVSRVIWMWVHGEWPAGHVDHINGDPADNRLSNLRDVSPQVNSQNRRSASSRSQTGLLGVCHHKNLATPYRARIIDPDSRKPIDLGYFKSAEAAHAAYLEAKRELHAGCTI